MATPPDPQSSGTHTRDSASGSAGETHESASAWRVCLVGSPQFCRRFTAELVRAQSIHSVPIQAIQCDLVSAWATLVSQRPQLIIAEVGYHHRDRDLQRLRSLLERTRERFGTEPYVTVALMASERLRHGGELLFKGETGLEASLLIDALIVSAPSLIPNVPSIAAQISDLLRLFQLDRLRRLRGLPPLPPLGAAGWAQSMADPKSRELWMQWLPRYATYLNENPIVIGETGAGKTNLAYSLHLLSGRKGAFISVTPRDFSSQELVQAELFGAVPGAYTGAVEKWGLVKSAEKGTLFVDELQSIDKDLQGKIITFIEDKTYRRVGSAERIEADVRFVFASNKSLQEMLAADILRHDFAYRLERVQLELLPLRDRRLDIGSGLAYALAKVLRPRSYSVRIDGCTSEAYRLLFSHRWPGNLRQLENTVAQLCEVADMREEPLITEAIVREVLHSRVHNLTPQLHDIISLAALRLADIAAQHQFTTLNEATETLLHYARVVSLEVAGGNCTTAAELLGENPQFMELLATAARREFEYQAR